jgi:hypothetical protein
MITNSIKVINVINLSAFIKHYKIVDDKLADLKDMIDSNHTYGDCEYSLVKYETIIKYCDEMGIDYKHDCLPDENVMIDLER